MKDWQIDFYIGRNGMDERAERMLGVWELFVLIFGGVQ